jgi:purine nucleotide phosphorylase
MTMAVDQCVAVIRTRAPDFAPRVGIVLGSGLGGFAIDVGSIATIPYTDLPGFPAPGVEGHSGKLVLGHMIGHALERVRGTPVALLAGRAHYYEHGRADAMKVAVRTLARLGCETLILTNSAGSLHSKMKPGSVMLITDHINFTGQSPLFGESGTGRFVNMAGAYDPAEAQRMIMTAAAIDVPLHKGVYMWFSGPQFETPAEIRAALTLGADAVGMSTVPEVILARHAGLKVVALSAITNLGAGMSDEKLSHDHTLQMAAHASSKLRRLLGAFLEGYKA